MYGVALELTLCGTMSSRDRSWSGDYKFPDNWVCPKGLFELQLAGCLTIILPTHNGSGTFGWRRSYDSMNTFFDTTPGTMGKSLFLAGRLLIDGSVETYPGRRSRI